MVTGANWKRPWEDTGGDLRPTASGSSYGDSQNSVSLLQRPDHPSCPSSISAGGGALRPFTPSTIGPQCPQRPVHRYGSPDGETDVNSQPSKRRRLQQHQCGQASGPIGSWTATEANRSSSNYLGALDNRPHTPPQFRQTLRSEGSRRASEDVGRESQASAMQTPSYHSACSSCGQICPLVQDIVSGLSELMANMRCDPAMPLGVLSSPQSPEILHAGIPVSLEWACGTVRNMISAFRDRAADRAGILDPHTIEGEQGHRASWSRSDASPSQGRGSGWIGKESGNAFRRNWTGSLDEHSRMTSNVVQDGRRRSVAGDVRLAFETPEPIESVAGAAILLSPRSTSRPTSGLLPTPSTTSFPSGPSTLPPISPPSQASQSAQATHFQDLQHQVSTKTLALQTLQREHDHLLSVYSRSKTRCATLEKKFQVSDAEINQLVEERIGLQTQVEALQAQVESLTKSRDDARAQSVANGAQYMKIMSMASCLEARSAADTKRWTTEREEWDRSSAEQERRIAQLQKEKEVALRMVHLNHPPPLETEVSAYPAQFNPTSPILAPTSVEGRRGSPSIATTHSATGPNIQSRDTSGSAAAAADAHSQDEIVGSESLDVLRAEIIRLRKACQAMGVALQDLKTDGYRIEQVMQTLGNLGKRVVAKADGANQYLRRRKSAGESLGGAAHEDGRGDDM
ncbi:MAG: hypothetical protein M1816_006998 [Peltula sp. TS41687]|nr:MAG: hypothetical protein M1816_006998 [Peltula sp. TS41687]